MQKNPLKFKLRNQLILVMVFMLILFAGSVVYLQQVAEDQVLDLIENEINSTMKAIEISTEQIHAAGASDEARLTDLIEHLRQRGVEEISVLGKQQEVKLSSNPQLVGSRLSVSKNEVLIQETIGDNGDVKHKKIYSAFVPIISNSELDGYIHISMYFDDLEKFSHAMLIERIVWALPVVGIGLIMCILIANRYTRPIPALIEAIHAIAREKKPALPADLNTDIKALSDSLGAMFDKLSTQKRLEEKLKRSEHQAMLAQLASGIAHEIRNPLNFISLSIDHVYRNPAPASEADKEQSMLLVKEMKGEIERINQMVANFLDLGREVELHSIVLKADLAVEEVLGLNRRLFDERRITVQRDYCNPLPEVAIDIDKMKSCFINLVANAVDAMPSGGTLRVAILQKDGAVRITFQDTGSGIAPENLPKLFEPYFTTKRKGVGLGLAIAKRMVSSHRGDIEITSTAGKGTCATVSLPTGSGTRRPDGSV